MTMTDDEKLELATQLGKVINALLSPTESMKAKAWLRLDLDSGDKTAPVDPNPLTIDVYDDNSDADDAFYSVTLSELIERMIDDRSLDGRLDHKEPILPFLQIRDELRHLADLIDEALSTREEDAA